jgi:uncharacterized protein (TIGR03437 family)
LKKSIVAGVIGVVAALTPATCRAQGYVIATVAGGNPFITSIGDGQPAVNAFLNSPTGVAVDAAGNFYIADEGSRLIRKVGVNGIISTFAGTGASGFSGDSGLATSAALKGPSSVAVDSTGNVYIADTGNNRVRKVDTHGIITTVAGSANTVIAVNLGDGGPAISANLNFPRGVVADSSGNLYISDTGNLRVRKVDTTGTITTVVGNGSIGAVGNVGDGGAATAAAVNPVGLALDSAGNLYIADGQDNLIRKVSGGMINSIAGNGNNGYIGDGSTAVRAMLNQPQGVAVDSSGNVFIADTGNEVIREVNSSGVINTIAGTGNIGNYGDGGPATAATLDTPTDIAMGASGTVYIANASTDGYKDARIRLLTPASGAVPSISANGVVPVFSTSTSIATGSWISIYGSNLASATSNWNGDFPTNLGQVAVTIDSRPAYLWFVSPTQINAQVPDDSNTGTVNVSVSTPGGTSTTTVTLSEYAPSFSLLNSKYPAAIVLTPGSPGNSGNGYDIIGPVGAFSFTTRPVAAGETLILYGVGFGPTQPTVPAGRAFSSSAPLVTLPTISIGNIQATVNFGGLVEAGLYQFNVVVPAAGSGDQILQATVGGVTTQSAIYITLR